MGEGTTTVGSEEAAAEFADRYFFRPARLRLHDNTVNVGAVKRRSKSSEVAMTESRRFNW